MRPYVQYQGIYYYSTAINLKNSDLGNVVTTVGEGTSHATSCLLDPGTPLYSIKGHPITSRLASSSNGQITLFEVITLTPSPTISPLKSIIGAQRTYGLEGTERNSLPEGGIAFSGNA